MKVCIVSEGAYPIERGGLSEWAHLLIKTMKDIEFDVLCVTPIGKEPIIYEKLPNINKRILAPIITQGPAPVVPPRVHNACRKMANALEPSFYGQPLNLEIVAQVRKWYPVTKGWFRSRSFWDSLVNHYSNTCPDFSFNDYYWTMAGLHAILLSASNFMRYLPKADVYHALSTGFAGLFASLAKVRYGSPMLVTEQGVFLAERRNELNRLTQMSEWFRSQIYRFSESLVQTSYRYADRIVPPCYSHARMEKGFGVDPAKINVIPNGIDLTRFPVIPFHDGEKPIIGCFARVVPIKGITDLIKTAKLVLERYDASFVVLGEVQNKEYYEECRQLVSELGLQDKFKFMGHVNPLEWYRKVDIFVLSSLSEGVPYALLEAMSCGLPCVCTAVGGVPEIVADGVGFVVPPGQPESLAERISTLLDDKQLRVELGQRAAKVARVKYNINDMATSFRNLYEELMNGKKEPAARRDSEQAPERASR